MRILDLYCGAGGASVGLSRVWPEATIVGVDIRPQPRYPFVFMQFNALEFLAGGLDDAWDFIWASPPCQAYTPLRATTGKTYPDLVGGTRSAISKTGAPWVIENVPQAPLVEPIMLCGTMFPGLRVFRHRHFEANFDIEQPKHERHSVRATGSQRGRKVHYEAGGFITISGDVGTYCGDAMGIEWMNGNELSQAVPPAYAEYVGRQCLSKLHAV